MGGTTRPTTLAGGPPDASMAAIPNPENLPLDERRRIYGNKYDHLSYKPLHGQQAHGSSPPAGQLRSWRDAEGKLVVAMRPIANPEDMTAAERRRVYGKRYAPRPSAAPKRWGSAARSPPAYGERLTCRTRRPALPPACTRRAVPSRTLA